MSDPDDLERAPILRPVCTCAADWDRKLVSFNTSLVTTVFTGCVLLRTEKIDAKVRSRATAVVAAFCPFCGEQYVRTSHAGAPLDQHAGAA